MQRRENLTWIEQPLVVERAFKSLLLIEVGLGEHRRHQVALLDADAMLASEHAADFDAELEDIGTEGTLAERESAICQKLCIWANGLTIRRAHTHRFTHGPAPK
jgi:hypothetical protein